MIAKKRTFALVIFAIVLLSAMIESCQPNKNAGSYQGTPFSDSVYTAGVQTIPGKLQCEYYDFGGEGVSFHDSDTINEGSGGLNPEDGRYINAFRKNEAVDISYTKVDERLIDNNPYNFVEPEKEQFYIGWTAPGEWTKYTVNVAKSGTYQVGIMYTANQNAKISLAVNDIDQTGPIAIPSTFVQADSLSWRQWHHWNYIDSISSIELDKGRHTVTLHTVEIGWMNYDFVNFALVP